MLERERLPQHCLVLPTNELTQRLRIQLAIGMDQNHQGLALLRMVLLDLQLLQMGSATFLQVLPLCRPTNHATNLIRT